MQEEKIKLALAKWLEYHGVRVFWEKKNAFGYPVFKVRGLRKQPDLLLNVDSVQSGPLIIAAEVKQSTRQKDVLRGVKIRHYADNAAAGKTQYIVNDLTIQPNVFLLATGQSIKGRLWEDDLVHIPDTAMNPSHLMMRTKYRHILPRTEYNNTCNFVRQLWQEWDIATRSASTSLGVLLSTNLDHSPPADLPLPVPKMLAQQYQASGKWRGWKQRWIELQGREKLGTLQ